MLKIKDNFSRESRGEIDMKKGFTLIELLAVIIIIAILITMVASLIGVGR